MNVIAPLRDKDVLLTSSTAGYKLPTSAADIAVFVQHAETVCVPMLNRVDRACRAVKLLTKGDVDVLATPSLAGVRGMIAAIRAVDDADAPAGGG